MRIRTRLTLNSGIIVLIMGVMLLSLGWSFLQFDKTDRNVRFVAEMEETAYQRLALRDEYLILRVERAKVQLISKTDHFRKLLEDAGGRFTGLVDKTILQGIQKKFDETVILFSQLTDYRNREKSAGREDERLSEQERQMIGHFIACSYDLMSYLLELKESASQASDTTRERSISLIVLFMCVAVIVTIGSSFSINHTLAKRIEVLGQGVVIIGTGNLRHRIPIAGSDELTELAKASNEMTDKLEQQQLELETVNAKLLSEIAEHRRTEELLQARNDELKAFAYTVSHDLKAPLRGIAGYGRELSSRHSTGLSERALFCIKNILSATNSLDHLIEDLLRYSRLDVARTTFADVNPSQLLQTILKNREQVLVANDVRISVEIPFASLPCWEQGLAQALANVIDNALKYSRNAQSPTIAIRGDESAHAHRIMVSDNGIGFDMKYHDRIFGLFNRLVRQEDYEGTGAGLAIARKGLEKQGGRIWAESQPGVGTTFFIEIPRRKI